MDLNYLRDSQSANLTIAKSKDSIIKSLRVEEPKVCGSKSLSGPQRSNRPSEKTQKMEKKE